jgi:hypothetical protein
VKLDRNETAIQCYVRKHLRTRKRLRDVHVDTGGNIIGNPNWKQLRGALIARDADAKLLSNCRTGGTDASASRPANDPVAGPFRKSRTIRKQNLKGNRDSRETGVPYCYYYPVQVLSTYHW